MIKYLTRFTSLLAYLLLLASCVNELENTEVHVPEVKINGTLIELATQTICWSAEECLDILGASNSELTNDKVVTNNHSAKIGEQINIIFHDTSKPSTLYLNMEELTEYHDQWSYNGETIKVDLPNQPGTYTYNLLVYWHGEKASTEGLINYQSLMSVE